MQRRAIANPALIIAALILQIIPLVILPADSFSLQTQEWWLPVLLTVMVIIADGYLIVGRTTSMWPWSLISFAQGFNLISRLMLLWPHATVQVGKAWVFNAPYVVITLVELGLSAVLLWYTEQSDVRTGLLRG
jgi:hypothetical protein